MTRPRRTYRTVRRTFKLPEQLVARVELELFSVTTGRIPYGAWARLIEALLKDRLARQEPLAPQPEDSA